MKIRTLEVGPLKSNCYLVIDERGNDGNPDCLIIDPGDDADYVQRVIADEEAKPISIIATHGHFDHVLACYELQTAYNIPFLIHKDDEFLLDRMQSSAKHFTGIDAPPKPKVSGYLIPGNELKINNFKFKIFSTPGHTPGSVSLSCKEEGVVFVGDLLFADGYVGRTDFKYASSELLRTSIQNILKLPGETFIYTGHGVPTSVEEVKLTIQNL